MTVSSQHSTYCVINLEQISDGLQPSLVWSLIIIRCFTLTCIFASLIFLTTDKSAQYRTPSWMTLEQRFHFPLITTFNGTRCVFELRTNCNSYLPAHHISDKYLSLPSNVILPRVWARRWVDLVHTISKQAGSDKGLPHLSHPILALYKLLTYLLTPWSRVLLEKLTSKLCS